MNRIGMAVLGLFFIGVGGYQALFPEKLIRFNASRPLNWQPRWARKHALSAPNVWATRIVGAVCCVIGAAVLIKAVLG